MSTNQITISADVAADPDTVWTAYTSPDHITQWNFASDDWCCPTASNDLRVGGAYSARMEAKDGSFGFDFTAIYDAVDPAKSFTYTMEDGRKVTTTFDPQNDTTRVTTTFDAETQNPVEMQREGWQAILNNFKTHAESL
ncbi:SRPBCC family protein [Pseudooceanicola sp. MF1-13]|uniref:SRPBCC family protein n=1 Tax=Pseudooceanicola sp. MF1-13 TaxID=3379095 RepID=UPI003891BECB